MRYKKKILTRIFAVTMLVVTLAVALIPSVGASDAIWLSELVNSENVATTATVGQPLYLRLWRDNTDTHTREYYLSLDTKANDVSGGYLNVGYIGHAWDDLDGNGYYSDYTLAYALRHDGSDSGAWYEPSFGVLYDYVEIRVIFRNIDRAMFEPSDVFGAQCTYPTEVTDSFNMCGGVVLNKARVWEYSIYCRFFYQDEFKCYIGRDYNQTPDIKVSTQPAYFEGYSLGESVGYDKGYRDGVESMEEYDMYSMITALVVSPVTFVKEALNFDVFGVNISGFVTMLMTLALIALVVVVIVRFVV